MSIKLPISKSIANRILLLQAIHGDPLMRVSSDMPDDVRILHDALEQLREYGHRPIYTNQQPLRLYLGNCGTALRFLQVHLQVCYPGEPIVLEGDARLTERDGAPTSQTTSAWLMHGKDIPPAQDESPYITMTRKVIERYNNNSLSCGEGCREVCWSAAAFWYEYVAIHGGELLLEGLTDKSIQGDRVVADIFAKHFSVQTDFTSQGAIISTQSIDPHKSIPNQQSISTHRPIANRQSSNRQLTIDFTNCPDLYPAIALTCERLGVTLNATGTERLRYKESDRLEAVRLHEVRNDHRIAMALLAADYLQFVPGTEEAESLQRIIAKSYPRFLENLEEICTQTRKRHDNDTKSTRKRIETIL